MLTINTQLTNAQAYTNGTVKSLYGIAGNTGSLAFMEGGEDTQSNVYITETSFCPPSSNFDKQHHLFPRIVPIN